LKKPNQANQPQIPQNSLDTILIDYTKHHYDKGLTKREAEITAFILQGHSSLSISLILNISTETVKVHRKNIYRKLRISSQAELFMKLSMALKVASKIFP
jgi:DNA-binding CsgD family transcriptional regulator